MRNVVVGDIVHLAEAGNDDPPYRLGKVVEADPGEDGCVRTVRVKYTNPGKAGGVTQSPPKTHERRTHATMRSAQGGRSSTSRRGKNWQ